MQTIKNRFPSEQLHVEVRTYITGAILIRRSNWIAFCHIKPEENSELPVSSLFRREYMTFSCKNYEFGTDTCDKLKAACIPGRPGCVLEGKVKLSDGLEKRLAELAEEKKQTRRRTGQ
jgi:hypothetical protein